MSDEKPGTDSTSPIVLAFTPVDAASGVSISSNIVLSFNEAIQVGAGSIVLRSSTGVIVETFDVATNANISILGWVLTINPSAALAYATSYSVEFATGCVQDLAGNSYAGTTSYGFTTVAATSTNILPTGAVTIAGTATLGKILTVNTATLADADGLGTLDYQWLRAGSVIGGATGSAYSLTASDVANAISVRVSYTDLKGTAETMTSSPTAAVAGATNTNMLPTGAVTIAGTATLGQILTANTATLADADGLGALGYQWLRAGSVISGAIGSAYSLTASDVANAISVRISYTDLKGTAETMTSSPTVAVADATTTVDPTLAAFVAGFDSNAMTMVGNVELNGALYVLSTKLISATNYRADPDGTKAYLTSVVVTKIGNGRILAQNEVAQLYAGGGDSSSSNNSALSHGAIGVANGNVKIFFVEKDSGLSYGQNGYAYLVNAQSLASSASTVFSNANWGWYPRIDSNGDILHFSFAGYYTYKNTTLLSSTQPADAVLVAENQKLVTAGLSGNLTSAISANALSALLVGDLKSYVGAGSVDTTGHQTFTGTTADDTFSGSAGNDTFDGGAGIDTLVCSGNRSVFVLTKTSDSFTVTDHTGAAGIDTVQNVERLKFWDGGIALDVGAAQSGGQTQLLLGAVLGVNLLATKQPLIGAVIGLFDQGFTLQQLSGAAMRLPIWAALTGSATPTNTQIAAYLLTTVNGVAPDARTLTTAAAALDGEYDAAHGQGNFLWHLAESAANQLQVGLVGLAVTGLAYTV